MTDTMTRWLIIGCACCLGIIPMTTSAAAASNSLAWCLHKTLAGFGLPASYPEILAQMGPGFAPTLAEGPGCFRQARTDADVALIRQVCARYGLVARVNIAAPGVQRSVLAQSLYRSQVQEALRHNEPVIVQVPSEASVPTPTWGLVRALNPNGTLQAATPTGARDVHGTPTVNIAIAVSNACPTPSEQLQMALRDAARLLRGMVPRSDSAVRLLSGVAALDHLADAGHRVPWCPACGRASAPCLSTVLRAWADDLSAGLVCLEGWQARLHGTRAAALKAARVDLGALRERLDGIARNASACVDAPAAQARLAEEVRAAKLLAWQAGNQLARAGDAAPMPMPAYTPTPLRASMAPRSLAEWLPLYRAMDDGDDSLLCSLLIALRLAGVTDAPELLRAPYTGVLRLELAADDCNVAQRPIEQDAYVTACLDAAGYTPWYYTSLSNDPPQARDFIRREIIASLEDSRAVLAHRVTASNCWSVIAGCAAQGRELLCRTPSDTTLVYRSIASVPPTCLIMRPQRTRPSERDALLAMLRQGVRMFTNAPAAGRLSGNAAWQRWQETVQAYAVTAALPPRAFARGNAAAWTWLRDNRRAAYKFFELAAVRVPELARYLAAMHGITLRQVTEWNHAWADGFVLREENNMAWPPDWFGPQAAQQAAAMSNAFIAEQLVFGLATNALAWYDRVYTTPLPKPAPPPAPIINPNIGVSTAPAPAATTPAVNAVSAEAMRARKCAQEQREQQARAALAAQTPGTAVPLAPAASPPASIINSNIGVSSTSKPAATSPAINAVSAEAMRARKRAQEQREQQSRAALTAQTPGTVTPSATTAASPTPPGASADADTQRLRAREAALLGEVATTAVTRTAAPHGVQLPPATEPVPDEVQQYLRQRQLEQLRFFSEAQHADEAKRRGALRARLAGGTNAPPRARP